MTDTIRALSPNHLWNHFADINAIPRVSKKEEKIRQYMVDFANSLNLPVMVDSVGNVIIKKPASKTMQDRQSIIMQAHLDMVCQKNNGTDFDFETQGINMLINDDWVTADGTTLGADNGIGVAAIMSVLKSNDIEHPAIEALFTIDEETGMTGAKGLQADLLEGQILLNLDTENDEEIAIGCAGGIDVTATKNYQMSEFSNEYAAYSIKVKGLRGGHSGIDIHKGYGNANKILNRILFAMSQQILISEIDAGGLRNAIPREASAIVISDKNEDISVVFNSIVDDIVREYHTIEADLAISIEKTDKPVFALNPEQQIELLQTIYAVHNGVLRMSPDMQGLVETSNNLARVTLNNGEVNVICLTRSATEQGKIDMVNQLKSVFNLAGFEVELSGSYPGWKPNPNSDILNVLVNIYSDVFNAQPRIIAYHAGLECGILGKNYPDLQMISFGPTIERAHSPDERVCISSTQKFWKYLINILANIPKKAQ